MAYLYAGLGVAMLAGIMTIFEMGLALTGQSLMPSPTDAYLSDPNVKQMDQKLLGLLNNPARIAQGLEGTVLCSAMNLAYKTQYSKSANPWVEDSRPPINTAWLNSCVMNDGSHRVLISPDLVNPSIPYQFYSCVVDVSDDRCSFEHGS
ncbi:hypothetical protein OAE35_03070 [Synechococcus sp. AH-551-E02]|nr:hypothetical protein [Synechococcus sp. AH-551-E02]MDB4653862.1 hypothetical protein [Synechococcus sp. AH-551-E02]